MDVEGQASRYAMEAANEIKEGGTEAMSTATPDPPETGGVEAIRTGKAKPSQSAGTMARKATGKASAGRSAPISERTGSRSCSGHTDKGNRQRSHYTEGTRESRKRFCLRDETRSKFNEADHPEIGRGVVRRLRRVKSYDEP